MRIGLKNDFFGVADPSGDGPVVHPWESRYETQEFLNDEGNSFLRKYLYLIVENMVMHKADNAIKRFYSKKKSSGLCHKAAATAAGRKLLVTIKIFRML